MILSDTTIARATALESEIKHCPQVEIATRHTFHAGMYARTVRVPAGVVFTSVLVKIPTLVIVNGTCDVLVGQSAVRLEGYNVMAASSPRKTAYITRTQVEITMIFRSNAETVEQAEEEFTDEKESLLSHSNRNDIVMTEAACLESLPLPRS